MNRLKLGYDVEEEILKEYHVPGDTLDTLPDSSDSSAVINQLRFYAKIFTFYDKTDDLYKFYSFSENKYISAPSLADAHNAFIHHYQANNYYGIIFPVPNQFKVSPRIFYDRRIPQYYFEVIKEDGTVVKGGATTYIETLMLLKRYYEQNNKDYDDNQGCMDCIPPPKKQVIVPSEQRQTIIQQIFSNKLFLILLVVLLLYLLKDKRK